MSSTVVWVCRHIQSHVSKSLYLVNLDEVVGRTPYRGRTHRPRKASTTRGNYLRTTFQLGPPPPQVHPSMGVQLTTADKRWVDRSTLRATGPCLGWDSRSRQKALNCSGLALRSILS